MKVIYIAGPFRAETAWGVERNVRRAELMSKHLWGMGIANICPHTQGRFFDKEIDDRMILLGMRHIMRRCDAVIVIGDWESSQGSKAEMAEAEEHGIPIFHEVQELIKWASSDEPLPKFSGFPSTE